MWTFRFIDASGRDVTSQCWDDGYDAATFFPGVTTIHWASASQLRQAYTGRDHAGIGLQWRRGSVRGGEGVPANHPNRSRQSTVALVTLTDGSAVVGRIVSSSDAVEYAATTEPMHREAAMTEFFQQKKELAR